MFPIDFCIDIKGSAGDDQRSSIEGREEGICLPSFFIKPLEILEEFIVVGRIVWPCFIRSMLGGHGSLRERENM